MNTNQRICKQAYNEKNIKTKIIINFISNIQINFQSTITNYKFVNP